MNKVFGQIDRSLALLSAVFFTVLTTRVRGQQGCGPEKLVQCSKPLSVLTDSGLTFAASKVELDTICPHMRQALRCTHNYTRHCMNHNEQKHFRKLFHGTTHMVYELCKNGTYQEDYLKYAPCMKRVEKNYEVCLRRYVFTMKEIEQNTSEKEHMQGIPTKQMDKESDMLMKYQKRKREAADAGIRSVCCAFQNYVECSTHTMRQACGEQAAIFSRNFLDRISASLLQLHCTHYGPRECGLLSSSTTRLVPPIMWLGVLTSIVLSVLVSVPWIR